MRNQTAILDICPLAGGCGSFAHMELIRILTMNRIQAADWSMPASQLYLNHEFEPTDYADFTDDCSQRVWRSPLGILNKKCILDLKPRVE